MKADLGVRPPTRRLIHDPKATLARLAQAHLDYIEAGRLIHTERHAINEALHRVDPRYVDVPIYPGERARHSLFAPRNPPGESMEFDDPFDGFTETVRRWAETITSNTTVSNARDARTERVIAARQQARAAVIEKGLAGS